MDQVRSDGDGNAGPAAISGLQVEYQVTAWLGAADQRAAVGGVIYRVRSVADRSGQQACLACVAHAGAA